MAGVGVWWNGERLPQDEIALAVFGRQPDAEAVNRIPLLGAASSETSNVILLPTDFGRFLRQHRDATLVCYDAAALHWLLDGHFRNDAESLEVLWACSREGRLIDIMLLDQHVRRCHGEDGTVASPLHRLLRRRAEVELPDDRETERRVVAVWGMSQGPNDPVLELVSAVTAGIFRAYERLLVETKTIEDAVEASQLPPVRMPAPAPAEAEKMAAQVQKLTETILARRQNATNSPAAPLTAGDVAVEKPAAPAPHSFGPLGIGIDVQAVIALRRPDRPTLRLDSEQLDELRNENALRFEWHLNFSKSFWGK